jgi:hypothetical protein
LKTKEEIDLNAVQRWLVGGMFLLGLSGVSAAVKQRAEPAADSTGRVGTAWTFDTGG